MIGKIPIKIPEGVKIVKEDGAVKVKGPKGELSLKLYPNIDILIEGDTLKVIRQKDDRKTKAMHGTTRAILQNMVKGVKDGYVVELDISGIGYRAEQKGNSIVLRVGYSNLVEYTPPPGVKVGLRSPVRIFVEGIDKALVGEVAAQIRRIKPPDPYKGAGIRYADEKLILKPGKKAKGGKKK